MNLLITPALKLNESQQERLEETHKLFFLKDERIPLMQQQVDFDPGVIEGIVCNFFFQNNSVDVLPNLRFVQLTSAGLDRIPIAEFKKRNIQVYNAGSTYAIPMAEWAVCQILRIYKFGSFFSKNQCEHRWEKRRDIRELAGSKVAVIGFGNVGRCIAKRLRAFDMHVIAVDVVKDISGLAHEWHHISVLESVLPDADVVVLTLPLMESTFHIMNDTMLSKITEDAVLINIARGQLIDENALITQLNSGRFFGVALDVFEQEPLPADSPLWNFERVIISPHNSFVGSGNNDRLFNVVDQNLRQLIV